MPGGEEWNCAAKGGASGGTAGFCGGTASSAPRLLHSTLTLGVQSAPLSSATFFVAPSSLPACASTSARAAASSPFPSPCARASRVACSTSSTSRCSSSPALTTYASSFFANSSIIPSSFGAI